MYRDEQESLAFPRNAASCQTDAGFPFTPLVLKRE